MSESVALVPHAPATVGQCGAKTRGGTPCKQPLGKRTDHPGQGRCWLHGGATPIIHGLYSKIKRERFADLFKEQLANKAPLDLLPEVHLLRAVVIDFLERYDEMTEAILAWHASFDLKHHTPPHFIDAILWLVGELEVFIAEREELTKDQLEQVANVRKLAAVLEVGDSYGKPRKIIDISQVAQLIDKVGAMVERIQTRGDAQFMTREEFRIFTGQMATVVLANLEDKEARMRIRAGWNAIPMPRS